MGKKNKKTNFKKIPNQEFFAGTQSVPDRENIRRPSQGLQRKNEDRVSHNPGIGSKTTGVAPSCEIDIPLNDGSITQSASRQAVHVSCNNVTMEDPPTAVTGQMTKLDITYPSVDQTGVGLNVEAAEFRPTEAFTSSYATVSCSTSCPSSTSSRKWNSQPSRGLKPSLGDGSGYPMQQSSTFSNPNTHSDRNNTSDMYKLGGSNNARNFKNQSHIHQTEITRDSYNPLQKQDHSVQHGTTHTQENYEDIIGDSDSEGAANYASSRSKKCRTSETSVDDEKSLQELNKQHLGAKSTESSDSNNGKPSYRSKSREKRHEYGSDSYNKKEKAGDNYPESRDRRDGSKIHRSEGNNKMTEGKQKNRTKSPNRKEKSNYEDKYSGRDNRAHEAETSRSRSNNTEEKSKAQDHCYQSQDGQYESKSYTQQDVSHNRPDSRDSNRRNKYDSARSDDQNSRNNFSQDNPWQEAKGGRNRGPQHQRKPQTSRLEPPFDRQSQIDKSGYNDTKKHNQVSGSQTYKTVDSPSDKVSTKPEYEKGNENVVEQGIFQNCSFDTNNEGIDNWRNHTRQSLDGYDRDKKHKMGMIQRKSLGDERNTQKLRDPRMERGSMHWRNTPRTDDPEYEAFCEILRRDEEVKYIKVQEISGDLFEMPKEYSLGHCVAEDLSMGSGIAVQFKREFKELGELYSQRQKQGGLAILEKEEGDSKRYIYYLVTKRESSGKPTYLTFWSSLKKMRDHIRKNGVKKLAIPRIGCGLDRLEWSTVKHMIEFLFQDVDIEIVVCNFQQDGDTPTRERGLYCRVVRESYHITKLEKGSIIIYFSTEDGVISDEMIALQKRCNFIPEFQRARKALGETIRFDDWTNNFIMYGCIVRKNMKDPFQFKSFVKCLADINKQNKKDGFGYVGIPAIQDATDYLLNSKIVNIAKTYLRNVDVYHCLDNEIEGSSKETENEDSFISLDSTLSGKEGNKSDSKDNENADSSACLNDTKDDCWDWGK